MSIYCLLCVQNVTDVLMKFPSSTFGASLELFKECDLRLYPTQASPFFIILTLARKYTHHPLI